jgi:hypothetical protein
LRSALPWRTRSPPADRASEIAEAQARAQIARDNGRKVAIEVQIKEIKLAKRLAVAERSDGTISLRISRACRFCVTQ